MQTEERHHIVEPLQCDCAKGKKEAYVLKQNGNYLKYQEKVPGNHQYCYKSII